MSEQEATSASASRRIREEIAGEPRWKKILLIAAIVFIVIGLVLFFVEGGSDGSGSETRSGGAPAGSGAALPSIASSLTGGNITLPEGQAESIGAAADDGDSKWAPIFLRFGFSFFVGYALGFAARSVLKLALLFAGLFAALLFGFDAMGFVEVKWHAMGGAFDTLLEKVSSEAGSVKGLLTGRLPSGGLAMLGLWAGFRRG